MRARQTPLSCAGLTRAARLGTHPARLSGMAGTSPAMTEEPVVTARPQVLHLRLKRPFKCGAIKRLDDRQVTLLCGFILPLTFHETLSRFRPYTELYLVPGDWRRCERVEDAPLELRCVCRRTSGAASRLSRDPYSDRQIQPAHDRLQGRPAPAHLAGLDRQARLFDAVRLVQGVPHGEGSFLQGMGRRADAEFDLLHQGRPRHPWQLSR